MTFTIGLPQGHVVAFALPFWGHTKPLCALLAKLVRLRRIYVTFFTASSTIDKVLKELARQFLLEEENDLRALIRVVELRLSPVPFDFESYRLTFIDAYKSLCASEPIVSAPGSEHMYEAIPAPQLVILDFFIYESIKAIRSVSGTSVPIYAWQTGSAAAVIFLFGPERYGGNGDLAEKLKTITAEDEETRIAEQMRIYRRIKNELIELPGIPPMYDYEFSPQLLAIGANLALFSQYSHKMFSECDGVIHTSNRAYEGPAFDVWQEWYGSRPVLAIGPLSPPADAASLAKEKSQSPVAGEVEEYLHNALDKFGPNSVVYVSFGTIFWSMEPEKIWTVLDVLIELGIPFLFSHASPAAIVPDEVKAKVKASGLGYMAPWLPQQTILHHAACGWFVTHCGHNSVMEAFTEGVPLICWPFDADQPINAANISVTMNAGYELLEVRNGHGLRPMHRLGGRAPEGTIAAVRREAIEVFTKARGEDGRVKRANAQRLGSAFAHYWKEGGSGWTELKRLVDVLH